MRCLPIALGCMGRWCRARAASSEARPSVTIRPEMIVSVAMSGTYCTMQLGAIGTHRMQYDENAVEDRRAYLDVHGNFEMPDITALRHALVDLVDVPVLYANHRNVQSTIVEDCVRVKPSVKLALEQRGTKQRNEAKRRKRKKRGKRASGKRARQN
ncbi:hypothetical protein SPRG_19871, partial [Saprolegnia parasitica CBS 223.65]